MSSLLAAAALYLINKYLPRYLFHAQRYSRPGQLAVNKTEIPAFIELSSDGRDIGKYVSEKVQEEN